MNTYRMNTRSLRWLAHGLFGLLLFGFLETLLLWGLGEHGSRKFFTDRRAYHLEVGGFLNRSITLWIISGALQADGRFRYDPMNSTWVETARLPLGIRVGARPASDPLPTSYFRIVVPCETAAFATGFPSMWWFGALGARRYREWRLRVAALGPPRCANCGYDLRATPHRCPECGTIPLRADGYPSF